MSYVDLIIKYLSGDLSREESRAFEKELESDAELKKAFEEHSAAYRLIRSQLQKRDQEAFEAKLAEAMSFDGPISLPRKPGRRFWYLPPAIACFLAIFLLLFLSKPGNERIVLRFHHPEKDPIVLAYYQETRGKTDAGIHQYRLGNYERAMDLLSARVTEEKDNKLVLLYYLLSAMELDRQNEALELRGQEIALPLDLVDQSISWYSVLALIKSDRREESLKLLHPLTIQEGPYQADALKLEKLLLK
jgi:hypothetical protein